MTYREMDTAEKLEYWESQGWRFLYSSRTWSGGIWSHDVLGTINRQGGEFESITAALEAIERFAAAYEQITA